MISSKAYGRVFAYTMVIRSRHEEIESRGNAVEKNRQGFKNKMEGNSWNIL